MCVGTVVFAFAGLAILGLTWIAPGIRTVWRVLDDEELRFGAMRKERDRLHASIVREAKRRNMAFQEYALSRGNSDFRDLGAAALLAALLRLVLRGWRAPAAMRRLASEAE